MGLRVPPAELTREWSLSFADIDFVNAKLTGSRLGLAAQLKFFVAHGYFASAAAEISEEAVSYLADQLGVGKADLEGYDFSGRSGRRHCAEILRYLGFRRMKRADRAVLADWIGAALCPTGMSVGFMLDEVFLRCRDCRIFAPSRKEMERLVRSERQRFLETFLGNVADRLHPETVVLMEASLADPDARTGFHMIESDAGAATLDNMLDLAEKAGLHQQAGFAARRSVRCGQNLGRSDRSTGRRREGVGDAPAYARAAARPLRSLPDGAGSADH